MTSKFIIPFIFLLSVSCISCYNIRQHQFDNKANSNNIFASIGYDKVVAYNYNGEGDIEIIDEKGKLADKIKSQVVLTENQTIQLTNILCSNSTYGGEIAACFNPHFGIVFYKTDKPIAYVSICLDCNYLISSIKIPGEGGFSNDGIKSILDFEKQLKF